MLVNTTQLVLHMKWRLHMSKNAWNFAFHTSPELLQKSLKSWVTLMNGREVLCGRFKGLLNHIPSVCIWEISWTLATKLWRAHKGCEICHFHLPGWKKIADCRGEDPVGDFSISCLQDSEIGFFGNGKFQVQKYQKWESLPNCPSFYLFIYFSKNRNTFNL